MPLYEYECQSCHRRIEKIQKFSDPPLEVCPHCGGRLEKLISSPAFHLKGSGWYVTDYARKSEASGKSEKSEASDTSDKSAKSEGSETSGKSDKPESTSKPATDTASNKDTSKSASTKTPS